MVAVAFDTLKLARTLRSEAKMSLEQAEGVAQALAEAMSGAELATKADVQASEAKLLAADAETKSELTAAINGVRAEGQETKSGLTATIAETKAELTASIEAARAEARADNHELRSELKLLEQRMTIKLGAMLAAGVALLSMLKVFGH